MQLSSTQSDAFWKVYDEYEVERKVLGQTKIQLIDSYAKQFEKLTDETATN